MSETFFDLIVEFRFGILVIINPPWHNALVLRAMYDKTLYCNVLLGKVREEVLKVLIGPRGNLLRHGVFLVTFLVVACRWELWKGVVEKPAKANIVRMDLGVLFDTS